MLQAEVVHIIDGYKQPINLLDIRSLEELTIHWKCCNTNETFYYNVFNIQLNPAPQRKGNFSQQVKLGMQKDNFWLLISQFLTPFRGPVPPTQTAVWAEATIFLSPFATYVWHDFNLLVASLVGQSQHLCSAVGHGWGLAVYHQIRAVRLGGRWLRVLLRADHVERLEKKTVVTYRNVCSDLCSALQQQSLP